MCWRSLRSSADSGSSSSITAGSTAKGAGNRHALFLAARKLADHLVRRAMQIDQLQQFLGLRAALGLVNPAHLQAEGDVLPNRHQRKQREVLEDQRRRPLVGALALHVLAADPDQPRRSVR